MKNSAEIATKTSDPNRWILLSIYCFTLIFVGSSFLNWPPFRSVLVRDGAYRRSCDEYPNLGLDETCVSQRNKVMYLNTFAISFMLIGSSIGGLALDRFGPRSVSLTGISLVCLGYLSLSLSSLVEYDFAFGYLVGFILLGAGADPVVYGMLNLGHRFPGYTSTIVSIFGMCRSIAFTLPIFFGFIQQETKVDVGYIFGFWAFISAILFVVIYFVMPLRPAMPEARVRFSSPTKKSNPQISRFAESATLLQVVRSPSFFPFVFYFSIVIVRNSFFSSSATDQLGHALTLYIVTGPLSLIPCPILGFCVDRFGPVVVLIILSTAGLLMILFLTVPTDWAPFVSVGFYWINISFVSSQVYTFVGSLFPLHLTGRLISLCMLTAGLFGTSAAPLYLTASKQQNFVGPNLFLLGLSFAVFPILFWLQWSHHTPHKTV